MVIDGRLQEVVTGGAPSLGKVRQLEEQQAQADAMRQHAGEQVVKARIELDNVRAWARRELEAAQQVVEIRAQHTPLPA
jgi:hypothetical protein